MCKEVTSEEIGRKLFMSKKTVDAIRGKILKKLNVKTTVGVVMYALKNGIYLDDDINRNTWNS